MQLTINVNEMLNIGDYTDNEGKLTHPLLTNAFEMQNELDHTANERKLAQLLLLLLRYLTLHQQTVLLRLHRQA
jgi:hypothetical protein